jgi:hypothetical protein
LTQRFKDSLAALFSDMPRFETPLGWRAVAALLWTARLPARIDSTGHSALGTSLNFEVLSSGTREVDFAGAAIYFIGEYIVLDQILDHVKGLAWCRIEAEVLGHHASLADRLPPVCDDRWPEPNPSFPMTVVGLCTNFVPPSRERWSFWISCHFIFCNLQNGKTRGKNDTVSGHHIIRKLAVTKEFKFLSHDQYTTIA